MKNYNHFSLRLERAVTGDELGVLSSLKNLQNLELIDNEFKPGFDKGFVLLKSVRKTLLIPVYVDEVIVIIIAYIQVVKISQIFRLQK